MAGMLKIIQSLLLLLHPLASMRMLGQIHHLTHFLGRYVDYSPLLLLPFYLV
jgi:hypothetical protein